MTERRVLPQKRHAETFDLTYAGLNSVFSITLGFYEDGTLGEVFISGAKSGEAIDAISRDGAILLSLALQYGAPVLTLKNAITRDPRGNPMSIIGAVIDKVGEDYGGSNSGTG